MNFHLQRRLEFVHDDERTPDLLRGRPGVGVIVGVEQVEPRARLDAIPHGETRASAGQDLFEFLSRP